MTHDSQTLAALIRGALLSPTTDLPRMILADFLDEHTDMDSTVLRKPGGTWHIRTLFRDAGHHNTAVTYKCGSWSRWFSRDAFRITMPTYCRCGRCDYIWRWADHPTTYDAAGKVINTKVWRCGQCFQTRHRPTITAIKKATFGGTSVVSFT